MAGMIDKWLTEDALLLITGWARDGLTLEDIAHNMGMCRQRYIYIYCYSGNQSDVINTQSSLK